MDKIYTRLMGKLIKEYEHQIRQAMNIKDKLLIYNLVEELLGNFYENIIMANNELQEEEDELGKLNKEMQKVLSNLSDQQKKVIEIYLLKNECLIGKYNNKIYVQGFKDCIKLLKYVEVI